MPPELIKPRFMPQAFFKLLLAATALASAHLPSLAGANLHPGHSHSWGANLGWLNWRPDPINGAEIGQFICSGYIYSANVGWINLGQGTPANGIHYQNNSASDFGINMDAAGNLRGLAYGANIGWIHFETMGGARVDLWSGVLHGFVYSANTGWISLSDSKFRLAVEFIASGADLDGDGIPDAWELLHAGDLVTFNSTTDTDQDGQTDLQEYLAGTDPLDPDDNLRITNLSNPSPGHARITWTSNPTRQYRIEKRRSLSPDSLWTDLGLGLHLPSGAVTSRDISTAAPSEFYRIQAIRPLAP
jgi:hypothetical protein